MLKIKSTDGKFVDCNLKIFNKNAKTIKISLIYKYNADKYNKLI